MPFSASPLCPSQVLSELKFDFLREVCNHEHYIPLSLPVPSARIAGKTPSTPLLAPGGIMRRHL